MADEYPLPFRNQASTPAHIHARHPPMSEQQIWLRPLEVDVGKSGASHSLLVTTLLLLFRRGRLGLAGLLQVHEKAGIVVLWVPLETMEVGIIELIVGLTAVS